MMHRKAWSSFAMTPQCLDPAGPRSRRAASKRNSRRTGLPQPWVPPSTPRPIKSRWKSRNGLPRNERRELGQALRSLFVHILRQARSRGNALQLGAHQFGSCRFEPFPAPQRWHLPSRDLRIDAVDLQDHVGDEAIATPRRIVERPLVGCEVRYQGAPSVRISKVEVLVTGQSLDDLNRIAPLGRGLQCEPFVQHQAVTAITFVEVGKGLLALGTIDAGQH